MYASSLFRASLKAWFYQYALHKVQVVDTLERQHLRTTLLSRRGFWQFQK